MTLGLVYYWIDPLASRQNWQELSIAERLGEVRFDTNLNTTNHLLHPLAGSAVYGLARVNGLSVPAAFSYAAASSLVWEYVLEWREKPSFNDVVYTSVGGVPLGEFFLQLGDYVNSAPRRTVVTDIARALLGFPRLVHTKIDHEEPPSLELPEDALGFSSAYSHRFQTSYDLALISNDLGGRGTLHRAFLGAWLVSVPGFLRPGTFGLLFGNGAFTELELRLGFGETGLDESDLQTRATLFGRYSQSFRRTNRGLLQGGAMLLGVGAGLRFNSLSLLGRHDQLSTVHVLGGHAGFWGAAGGLLAHLDAELSLDFASLDSLAWDAFVLAQPIEGTKTVLQMQGYQFSYGAWSRLRGRVSLPPLELSASLGYGRYASIQGHDRLQEVVTRDFAGTEELLELAVGASLRFGPLLAGGVAGQRNRASSFGGIDVSRWDRDVHLTVGFVF